MIQSPGELWGKMSRPAVCHTEPDTGTRFPQWTTRDRHDINRGIKTKIQIYTIGIILASRRSRISILAHPSDHVRTPRFGNLPARSHINKWLTVPVTWSYSSNVIQYQMCKQLIKRTSVIVYTLYLIVANWLLTEMYSLVSSVKTRQV